MRIEEFQERLRAQPRPVVVDVWAPWCAPCRALGPRLTQVSETFAGQVDLWKINADEAPALVRALGIKGIPTLILYRDGVEVDRRTGVQSTTALQALFASLTTPTRLAPPRTGMSDATRWLRLLSGLSLWVLAAFTGWPVALIIAGAVILFSGWYDRCPLWSAVTARWQRTPAAAAEPGGHSQGSAT